MESPAAASHPARACPICQCEQAQVLHAQNFVLPEGHPLRDGYNVVACAHCGFVYADSAATQHDYDEFYARHSKYDAASISTGGGASPSDQKRLREMAHDIAPFLDADASILDIGCATGGLLRELQVLGFANGRGLDPSPASATFARQNFGIEIITGSLFEAPAIEAADIVLCSHVLEHVRDLKEAARQLVGWVKAGGLLYVEVPDAIRYADFLVAPFQDFNTEHINHFGLDSLRALFEPHGLRLVSSASKDIEAAPGVPYPALWAIWRRDDAPSARENAPSTAMLAAMKTYIRDSQVLMDAMNARLHAALPPNAPVIVWGTGQLLMKMLGESALRGADIRAFADGNPLNHGRMLGGVPILSPQELAPMVESAGASWPIVIGSTIHQDAIARRIREELRWSNPIVTLA
jgi:SAM-dependent methyltransferase